MQSTFLPIHSRDLQISRKEIHSGAESSSATLNITSEPECSQLPTLLPAQNERPDWLDKSQPTSIQDFPFILIKVCMYHHMPCKTPNEHFEILAHLALLQLLCVVIKRLLRRVSGDVCDLTIFVRYSRSTSGIIGTYRFRRSPAYHNHPACSTPPWYRPGRSALDPCPGSRPSGSRTSRWGRWGWCPWRSKRSGASQLSWSRAR